MVTGAEAVPCNDSPARVNSREFRQLMAKASRQLRARKWKPVPVDMFLRNRAMAQELALAGCLCFSFTIFHRVYRCCLVPPGCELLPIVGGPLETLP
jgi:hypothetical protein